MKFSSLTYTVLLSAVLSSGCRQKEPAQWVDLRFLAEESYELPASSPQAITLKVKSTDPWTVYGKDPGWCSVTPSEGGAGELFEVKVQYNENEDLDDRLDTLIIQSDYWIGTWIPVRQKGTAYLNAEGAEDIELGQFGGNGSFFIRCNQNWKLQQDKASVSWLRLQGATSGNGDAEIKFSTDYENKGERRTALLDILDRHSMKALTVEVSQAGVTLIPSSSSVRTDYTAKTFTLGVESNTSWSVAKENENIEWIDVEEKTCTGDGEISITLRQNDGNSIRTGAVVLKSEEVPGTEQVTKTIIIRQAHNPVIWHEFDGTEVNDWIINSPDNDKSSCTVTDDDIKFIGAQKIHRYDCPFGNYEFHVKEASEKAMPVIYMQAKDVDVRFFVNPGAGTTALEVVDLGKTKNNSTEPGTFKDVPYDNSKPHVFGISVSSDENGYCVFHWILDGAEIDSYATDGSTANTSSMKFSSDIRFHIFVGEWESGGTANQHTTYDGWQYGLPYELIDWGD